MNVASLAALAWLASGPGDFDATVAPILARRCLDCHSGADPKGKLDLSMRASAFKGGEGGRAIVAGKPEESPLWEMVDSGEMPPKSPLSAEEKAAIREWIARGAGWGTDPIDPYQATTTRRAGAIGGRSTRSKSHKSPRGRKPDRRSTPSCPRSWPPKG